NGDLAWRSADDGVIGDEIRIRAEEIGIHPIGVAAIGQFFERTEPGFFSTNRTIQFASLAIAQRGEVVQVEKGTVVGELRRLAVVTEAGVVIGAFDSNLNGGARSERCGEV